MKRLLSVLYCVAIFAPAVVRAEYRLEFGKTTAIRLRIHNHNAESIENLRFRLETDAEWLEASIAGELETVEKDRDGNPTAWGIAEVSAGGESPLELTVNVRISGTREAPTGSEAATEPGSGTGEEGGKGEKGKGSSGEGGGGSKGGEKGFREEDTPIGEMAHLKFMIWKGEENPGQGKQESKESGDRLTVPPWRSWRTEYSIAATYEDLAKKPPSIDWHLVDGPRGSKDNEVNITIHNRSEFKPLLNVVVAPETTPGPVEVQATKADDKIVVHNVQGMKVIDEGETGKFKVTFSVSNEARPGQTGTIYLLVRTSTLGAKPNPWDPVVMVNVTAERSVLKGDFEAFLYYNLPPLTKEAREKMKGAPNEETWMPLPKGTKISVAQVYMMRGPGSAEKPVEQFVGYGNVIDDRGYFICKLFPVMQKVMRFRIVADTIANVVETTYADPEKKEVQSIRTRGSRAAVTPFGKRVFRNISRLFLVERTKSASVVTAEGSKPRESEERLFWRPRQDQDRNFAIGNKILIPYYGYSNDLDPDRKKGILIGWEGELSTGGHINSFYDAPAGVDSIRGRLGSIGMDQSYGEIYANELTIASDSPGLIYHNHNELHHILSGLIRAQDFLATLDYFTPFAYASRKEKVEKSKEEGEGAVAAEEGAKPTEAKDETTKAKEAERTPKLPGVISYWHKKQGVEGGETGYALREDGTWRLVVQALKEDPDERDIGLVLRGYGAAVRRKFWSSNAQETDDEKKRPNYDYYARTSIKQAWQQGFDIFFAAAVLNSPKVENRVAPSRKLREARSVDLNEILARARKAEGDEVYQSKYRRLRGADNAVAVAAGLWRAAQVMSAERLIDEILFHEGGNIFWFLSLVRRENPDLLKDMLGLGLCPTVDRWPPAASVSETVSPDAMRMIWHPNDMVAKGKLKAWIVFSSVSDDKVVRLPLKGQKSGKEGIVFNFGHLRDGEEGESQLSSGLNDGEKCFWTIETTLGTSPGGKKQENTFRWPLQDFVATVASTSVADGDRTIYPNSNSSVKFKRNSTKGRLGAGNRSINSVLGGRKVLGGAVYTVRIMPNRPGESVSQELTEPAEMKLRWLKDEDPGDLTPGIYYFDREAKRWELVGNKRVGPREVMAMITKAGSYALMVDHLPPQIEQLMDVPDPFPATVEGLSWKLLGNVSEPITLTVQIEDKGGKVIRTFLKDAAKPVGPIEVTWDGKDEAGKLVSDGTYTYRLLAVDESKRAAEPVIGTVTVMTGEIGTAEGQVELAGESEGAPRVQVLGTALSVQCDEKGKFWMLGLTQGQHKFRFSAQGHFEEESQGELKVKGGELTLPPVSLTNVALEALRASSEVFTPDGDGDKDYVSVGFNMTRECPLDVEIRDEDGEMVATLQSSKTMAIGEAAVVWQGLDDDEIPQPSGWYTIHFVAHSLTEGIPQGEVKVLLDRGLVQNANAFPYTFSPNDDGFDDSLEIGYNLEDNALVSIRLLRQDGALLKELIKEEKQKRGWLTVSWDGKNDAGKTVPDGKYAFEIRPKYLTGHDSKAVRGEFSSDSVPPEIGEVDPSNGSILDTGLPTVKAKVLSDLSDIDPSQLKVKIDEQTVLADNYDEKTGVFTFTPKTSLGEGLHIAIAYAQDWAGNYAPPQAVSFKVKLAEGEEKFLDRVKPEVLDLQPGKKTVVYTATPLIFAKVRDGESGIDQNNIVVYVNGERVSNAVKLFLQGKSGKSWDWYFYEKAIVLYDPLQGEVRYVPIEPMKEGKNHISLEVLDRAGNRSARAESVFDVVVDQEPPVISKLQPANESTTARTDVVVSAKLEDVGKSGLVLDTLRLAIDGKETPLGEGDFQFNKETGRLTIPLREPFTRDAQHVIQLTIRDRAGNLSKPALSVFSIVEDGEPPRVDIISPREKSLFSAKESIALLAVLYDVGRSGLDRSSVLLKLDGKEIPADDPATAEDEGYLFVKSLLRWEIGELTPGKHVVSIGVKDQAGNVAQDAVWPFEVK